MNAARRLATFAIVTFGSFCLVPPSYAEFAGRWTPSLDMKNVWPDGTAVHLMLLRGDGNPYHSRVVWLKGRTPDTWFGGEWGWQPASDDCTGWPAGSFSKRDLLPPGLANIFCSGHTELGEPGGRMLVVGGTESGSERGMRYAKYLTPGTGTNASTWSDADSMIEKRWYPAATTLKSGVVVTTGSKYNHFEIWGGRKNGESSPSDEKLARFGIVAAGQWDSEVMPSGTRPTTREGHTVVAAQGWGCNIYFGGRRFNGFQNDAMRLYRNANLLGSDYDYTWQGTVLSGGTKPDPRFEHSAVVARITDMLVYGGRGITLTGTYQVFGDLWRLWNDTTDPLNHVWTWDKITDAVNDPPGPRFGHTAIWDAGNNRMLIFGGVSDTTSNASDNDVWAFTNIPAESGTWSKPPLVDGVKPPARFDHAMSYQDLVREDLSLPGNHGTVAYMFGGQSGYQSGQPTYSAAEMWALWSYTEGPNAGKFRWQLHTTSGQAPSPRGGHTMEQEAGTLINYVYGGVGTGAADDVVYAIDLENTTPTWRPFAARGVTLTNHAVVRSGPVFVRTPEFFKDTPGPNNDWTALTGSRLVQDWYGFNFLVPGAGGDSSRVFTAGPDDETRYMTIALNGGATPWLKFNDGSGSYFGRWGSAVLYGPGRIMRCGTRDTGSKGSPAVASTAKIDVTVASPTWTSSGNMAYSRVYHNLVALPTGEVLVTGGMGTINNDHDINPRQQPEIWDPAGNNGQGLWYGGDYLAQDPLRRGYHSTAILLPDARVLCAGGNHHDPQFADVHKANIYCPPYLFKANGSLATRPVITADPTPISLGQSFTLSVDNSAPIQKVCLIRPGATTHAFDQNQRYVPLSFSKCGSNELIVNAPLAGDVAPPGEYLLFVVGSMDGANVPSVAKWIYLAPPDFSDSSPPLINDLTAEIVTSNSVMLWWTDPADDQRAGASGTARDLLLRRSTGAINSDLTWNNATAVACMPLPGPVDTYHEKYATGLSCCQKYYFQLRARDDKPQLSPFHSQVWATTLCYQGCSGGGSSAQQSRTDVLTGARSQSAAAAAAEPAGPIVCETTPLRGGGWQVAVRMGTTWLESDAGVRLETMDSDGTWNLKGRFTEPGPYGLSGLRDRGRVVLNGGYRIQQIATELRRNGEALRMAAASHSRLGDLAASVVAEGTSRLAPGDTLRLTYLPDASVSPDAPIWFAIVQQSEGGALAAKAPTQTSDTPTPVQFALRQNEPNPFRGTTTIRFDLPRAADVRLEVFDLLGRRVRTLVDGNLAPGTHAVEWDQRDNAGQRLGPGVYAYRIQAVGFGANRKMILAP